MEAIEGFPRIGRPYRAWAIPGCVPRTALRLSWAIFRRPYGTGVARDLQFLDGRRPRFAISPGAHLSSLYACSGLLSLLSHASRAQLTLV